MLSAFDYWIEGMEADSIYLGQKPTLEEACARLEAEGEITNELHAQGDKLRHGHADEVKHLGDISLTG
jgi:hypothetical protein